MQAFTWTPESDKELGSRLTKAREKRGMTLAKVAEELGFSKATIGHWETGKRAIKHHDLARLCAFLSISADECLYGSKRWPFDGIEFESIAGLEPSEIERLEGAIVSTANHYGLVIKTTHQAAPVKRQANSRYR